MSPAVGLPLPGTAGPLALVGPLHQLAEVLSTEQFVPEPVRTLMAPVASGLGVAEQVLPSAERLVQAGWQSASALGATESLAGAGRCLTELVESAGRISEITARAAGIVVRGTCEVLALAERFVAEAAGMGPALFTPPGQVALVGLAAGYLGRGIEIVERVRAELAGPTAELQAVAAALQDAPAEPGRLPAAGAGAGAASGAAPAGGGAAAAGGGSASGSDSAPGAGGSADHPGGNSGSADHPGSGDHAPAPGAGSAGFVGAGAEVTLPDGSTATAPNPQAAQAVRNALTQQGVPYSWGGTSPGEGLDCSGLTQWAYGQAGVELPRLAQEQNIGTPIAQSDLAPGDLAVWSGHVAMCIGNGQLVEAGDPVAVSPIRTDNIGMDFYGFYRPTAT